MSICIVLITTPSLEVAKNLSFSCLQNQLIACASILPGLTSIYEWKGEVHESSEVQLILKTSESKLKDLESHIAKNHPYDCPEFIAIKADQVESSYSEWLNQCLSKEM